MSKLDNILHHSYKYANNSLVKADMEINLKQPIKALMLELIDTTLAPRADVRRLRQKVEKL